MSYLEQPHNTVCELVVIMGSVGSVKTIINDDKVKTCWVSKLLSDEQKKTSNFTSAPGLLVTIF